MKTSIELNAGNAPLARALPLSLLALLDLATLKRDYAQFLNESPEQNRWFVMRDREALPPQSFHEVLQRLAKGEGPLEVLRESEAELEPTPWHTLDYRASVSNRAAALAAIIGFWVVAVFVGWVALMVFGPRELLPVLQRGYFIAALALVGWLSIPRGMRGKLGGKQFRSPRTTPFLNNVGCTK
jgi:hypothetical protein